LVLPYRVSIRHQLLSFVEQALEEVAPTVFFAVVRDRLAPVALGGDDRFDVGFRQFLTDGVGVIPLVGQ
jgi:hypothetical protein